MSDQPEGNALFVHLTVAEILEIVAPLKQPAAIVRWFQAQGFTVKVRPNGMPLISRAHFEEVMNVGKGYVGAKQNPEHTEPDVAGFLAHIQERAKRRNQKP